MFSLETYQSASPVVLGVLITLLVASGVTWTIILAKSFQVWLIRKQNVKFRAAFWGAKSLQEAATLEGHNGPAYRVAQVGFETLKDLDIESADDLRHSVTARKCSSAPCASRFKKNVCCVRRAWWCWPVSVVLRRLLAC